MPKKFLVLLACLLFFSGCSVQDNVEIEIHTNNTVFSSEDKIVVTATATNTSNETISFISNGSCGLWLGIDNPYPGLFVHEEPTCNQADPSRKTLKSGESIEVTTTFYPKITMNPFLPNDEKDSLLAPTGDYNIIAAMGFEIGKPGITEEEKIHIRGGKLLLTSKEISKVSMEHPMVKRWVENHSGDQIAKEDNGSYYIRENGKWVRISEETYESIESEPAKPEQSFQDGNWILKYSTHLGDSPHTITVTLDPYTGEVFDVKKTD